MKKIILAAIALVVLSFVVAFFISRGIVSSDIVSGGLRVTYPNGGETLKLGSKIDILWESSSDATSNTGTVYAQSSVESQELYVIAQSIDLNSEGFGWKIGDALRSNKIILGAVPAGEYKIKVCNDASGACDLSDKYFEVVE